jgi:xylan 1,4-beta-xylosidase
VIIRNPILPGFHPDPSICRVGSDYYIATSTFEWWPAVRIHHSRDLVHWQHRAYAVTRTSQLDLRGHPDSAGVWAPCLSHAHGQFWLIYSDVRSMYGAYKDVHNLLITAPSIDGPWSEPVSLNSSGFDPSLFHDDDGRTWFLNQLWIHHPDKHPFHGIVLQEFDREQNKLVGPVKNIFRGTALGVVEGPHLYKRDGWYMLLTAEGGTTFEHAATVARSRTIDGPYEVMPGNPLLTAQGSPRGGLQRAGHASWVETRHGEWYMAHLCGRPIEWHGGDAQADAIPPDYNDLHCVLGRETALQRLEWTEDGWPRLAAGGRFPQRDVLAPKGHLGQPWPAESTRDDFDSRELGPHWNTLRVPADASWLSLTERPSHLRLRGRESLMSLFEQSLIARRQQHLTCSATTKLDFSPSHFQQMAGLVAYYGTRCHAYLHVTAHEDTAVRVLRLMVVRGGVPSEPVPALPLPASGAVELGVDFTVDRFAFRLRVNGEWQAFGPALDADFLSDEFACQQSNGFFHSFGFTGNFIGIACQDLAGTRLHADFDYFEYREGAERWAAPEPARIPSGDRSTYPSDEGRHP